MDNIQISTSIENETELVIVNGSNSKTLFMDSYISNQDNMFNGIGCQIVHQYQLSTDPRYISSVGIDCINSNEMVWNKSYGKSVTGYVNHLNPIQVNISSELSTYYPGQSLRFQYNILDRLGNIIPSNLTNAFIILFETDKFSTRVEVQEGGKCASCESGIVINSITIRQDIGKVLEIRLSIINQIYYINNDTLYFDIIGCP